MADDGEARLRDNEEMHRLAMGLSQQITWTVEADGTGLQLSDRYRELTGMSDDEDAEQSIHPDDRGLVQERWGESLRSGAPLDVECRLRMRDGSFRAFHVRAVPLRDETGGIARWYGISEDIHEQKSAELAWRDVQERYRLVAQATNDAVWDHDFRAGTIDWGENMAAIIGSGQPVGRTSGRWWQDRIHPDERLAVLKSVAEATNGDARRWSGTYRFRREDGSFADVLDRGFIIRDEEGRPIRAVGAMSDLTERHRAEAEISRIQAELIHVSRLSAMGAMASTLAHELNQPLAALTNFISGARRIAGNPQTEPGVLRAALHDAEVAARRAGDIVRRMRDLVARGKVAIRTEHLPQLIDEASVIAFIGEEAKGVRHAFQLDPNAAWVRVDRIQIQQVLINLIRNAIQALGRSRRREIVISTRRIGSLVEIEVADTGPGIRAEDPEEVFSEFMTTKRGGMGLGLPISRTIVEAHGGTIEARNRPEGGAAFAFTVPRARKRVGQL